MAKATCSSGRKNKKKNTHTHTSEKTHKLHETVCEKNAKNAQQTKGDKKQTTKNKTKQQKVSITIKKTDLTFLRSRKKTIFKTFKSPKLRQRKSKTESNKLPTYRLRREMWGMKHGGV